MHPKADEEKRTSHKQKILAYASEGKQLIYIDESGFAVDMPRTHGYSQKGKRCYGTHNWNAKGRINAIGAQIGSDFLTVSLVDGSVNSDVFHAWVEQDLLPKIPKPSVVIMDNATFHKRQDTQKTINRAGHILEYPKFT